MAGDRYHISDQHDTYFVTCTIIDWVDLITRVEYKEVIIESFKYCLLHKGLVLNGWVIMTNHIHFIGRCEYPHRMSDFLRDFKKFTSKKLLSTILETKESRRSWLLNKFAFSAKSTRRAKNYKIWKDDNHAVNLSDIDALEKLNYIHENPVRAGIVSNAEDYIYSSAIDYTGKKGLLNIELI